MGERGDEKVERAVLQAVVSLLQWLKAVFLCGFDLLFLVICYYISYCLLSFFYSVLPYTVSEYAAVCKLLEHKCNECILHVFAYTV